MASLIPSTMHRRADRACSIKKPHQLVHHHLLGAKICPNLTRSPSRRGRPHHRSSGGPIWVEPIGPKSRPDGERQPRTLSEHDISAFA